MKFATVAAGPARPAMPTARRDVVRLALDRGSVRRVDGDGHLHIEVSPISKANVCEYRGSEIPDGERLGLDPGRFYRLYRDPTELEKAAPSFAGKPVVSVHRPLTASDHAHKVVVGSIGQDVRWEPPYLMASLSIWDGAAIEGIASGEQRQLSAGYRYRAEMVPGTVDGVAYDGVMRSIVANHLAIVTEGRCGPDVVVGDEALKMKGKFMSARPGISARDDEPELDDSIVSKLLGYLTVILPADQLADVEKILAGQEVPNPEHTEMAGDAARRAAGRAQGEEGYLRRFPGADRLR